MLTVAIIIVSYLIGSIPFAYLLVKKSSGIDIRQAGTGNVGAMNSYETTKSRALGITVMLLDALKGVVSVLLSYMLLPDVLSIALASIFSVLGHNFSIFLKFKGGRGLATAAGVFAVVNPMMLLFWGVMFLAGWFIIKKNVHVASVTATVCAPLMIYYTPAQIVAETSLIMPIPHTDLLIFGSIVCFIILIKHIGPIIELFKNTGSLKQR